MIAIPRALARRFRAVARRCVTNARQHGPAPPLWMNAEQGILTLSVHFGDVVLGLSVPLAECGHGTLIVPLSVFESFEGASPDLVTLESKSKTDGTARWQERGLPRSVTFDLLPGPEDWPADPDSLATLSSDFLTALHEAGRSTAREPGRYAMHRLQIRGKTGQVIATDAKHCLIQGGFEFGFPDDLILPAVPVFGCKELAGEKEVQVGVVPGGWLAVLAGPWSICLRHDGEVRFPDVAGVVPRAVGTRLTFSDAEAELVVGDLDRWPKDFGDPGSVTLDLGDRICLRARITQEGEVIERVLMNSTCTGMPLRVVLNREHLARALSLGFRQFACASPERPIVARDEHRLFLTATLDAKSAILPVAPSSAAVAGATALAIAEPSIPPLPILVPTRRSDMPARESLPVAERHGHGGGDQQSDAVDLLNEAEALRTLLTEAANRIVRLVGALKHFRKERRALASAFSSLRQLNLGQ